jgi:hypothetical protein
MTAKEPKHLIFIEPNQPLADVCLHLTAARAYLACQGKRALIEATEIETAGAWGSEVKRRRVNLPPEPRRQVIPEAVTHHSLIEIINQCATLDRLLDAMAWAGKELSAFHTVELCHPTTSSNKAAGHSNLDNDLILTDGNGLRARFEVSDVASEKDGNDKELRDLISLGVVRNCKGADRLTIEKWPDGLLFLVVSEEFARGILSRKRLWIKKNHLKYTEIQASKGTTLLKVERGREFQAEKP